LARADDDEIKPAQTGNWFTRLFAKDPAKKKNGDGGKDDKTKPAAPSPAVVRQKAYYEWQRRLEVCDKLKLIALQTGDQELSRKADALDQRIWDVYVQRTGATKGTLSPDEQILEGRLGMDSSPRTRGAGTASGTASATFDGRTGDR